MLHQATIFFLLAGFGYLGVPLLYGRWSRWRLGGRCRTERRVALTFDDGPGSELTPRLLDELDAAGVRATFFVVGRSLEGREALLAEVAARGHAVGCHGERHLHHWRVAPWSAVADIARCWQRVSGATGRDARRLPFRPPHGKLNLVSLVYLLAHRTPIALWTADGGDTWGESRPEPRVVAEGLRRQGGGVVLLHDFDRDDPRTSDHVLATTAAVARLAAEGYEIVPVSHLLGAAARGSGPRRHVGDGVLP